MGDNLIFSASSGTPSGAGIADVIIAGLQSAAQSYQAFLASQRNLYYPQIGTGSQLCPQGYVRNTQGVCVPLASGGTSLSGNTLMYLLLGAAALVLVVVLVKK